ncbi:MAG: TonB-dependent receptor [Burkholderiales bacterium]|nr:TonB-dependent receptor [Burkholderiales bacterium]
MYPFTKSRTQVAGTLRAVAKAALLTCLCPALPVLAQTAPPTKSDLVEITGSSIKRIAGETALPVQVITRSDIARTGVSTVEQLLKTITASSTLNGTAVANTGAGGGQGGSGSVSLISLRGLGSARTLVLINGRRSAPSAGGSAVDIATIPLAAIERVEVLQDGASAIYGSDAVAGVVNFILRTKVTGTEVSATLGSPTRSGGGQEARFSVLTGFGDLEADRYNVTAAASYQHIKPIFGSSRSFARNINVAQQLDKTSSIAFPANVFLPSGKVASPNYPNCGAYSIASPLLPGLCRYDNAPYISIQPESKLANLMVNARFEFSPNAEGYLETSLTRNKTLTTQQHVLLYGAALPAGSPYTTTLSNLISSQYPQYASVLNKYVGSAIALLPPTSPYYPAAFAAANGIAGQPLPLLFRSVPTGTRKTEDVTDNVRVLAGLRGTALGWDYDTGALFSQNKLTTSLTQGWALTDKYLSLVDTGVINPFGDTTDPAALAAAMNSNYNGVFNTTQQSIASIDAKVSRDLFSLPAGMVGLALGGEFRKEKLDIAPSDANRLFLVSGFGSAGVPVSGSRNVASAYAEVNVPILKTLEADAAVRYDRYQRVGSTVNPKGSLRWQPIEQLLVRGSWGSGFRAPTLFDLYQPPANGITTNGQRDRVRCPVVDPANIDCSAQYVTITGGNPGLKPEKSESITLGFVIEPNKRYSLGLDFFHVTVKDIIRTGLAYQTILGDPVTYAGYLVRGAPDGNPSGVGPILGINQGLTNLGKTIVGGVDVDAKARVLSEPGQRVTLRLAGTYMSKYDQQNLNGSYTSAVNNPGGAGAIGVVLRWRHVASATWEAGPWASTLAWNYQNPYHDTRSNLQPLSVAPREVASYSTFDAQVAYTGLARTTLTLGVKNLADTDPPYTNYGGGFVGSYDLSYTDVRGRFAYVNATYRF